MGQNPGKKEEATVLSKHPLGGRGVDRRKSIKRGGSNKEDGDMKAEL